MYQPYLTRLLRLPGNATPAIRIGWALSACWLLVPLFLLLMDRYSDIDLYVTDRMFDFSAVAFPWRYKWLTDVFGHAMLKIILTAGAVSVVVACAADAMRPCRRLHRQGRLRLRVIALSAVLVPGVVSALKHGSTQHCPWDLQRYGGAELYHRLTQGTPPGAHAGHCFPAGHVSAALWMVAFVVIWWPRRPRFACMAGVMFLVFGFAVGWLQQLRGAHFLSHTLWSMWIACTVVATLFLVLKAIDNRCPA